MPEEPSTLDAVRAVVREVRDPESGRGLDVFDQVPEIRLEGPRLTLTLALTTWSAPLWEAVIEDMRGKLRAAIPSLQSVEVTRQVQHRPPQKLGELGLPVKSVIAVGSGKGGVGKSTIAATLALSLHRAGCQVGLLDADVYGPSIPHLLGLTGRATMADDRLQPLYQDGMPVMSIGMLIPEDQPLIWRGPMLHSAVTQLLRDTQWGSLDYLIVDMPPGTGDVVLSLSQLVPLSGAVVVCTPQDVALLDAVRAIGMFRRVEVPVLGMVENMSGFVCPESGKRYDLFGRGGARERAARLGVPFLGELPIEMPIREHGDAGSTAANFADPALAARLEAIAQRMVQQLAEGHAASPSLPDLPVLG